jgi:threonine aldolase
MVLDPGTPFTNMIFTGLSESVRLDTREVAQRMAEHGVRVGVVGKRRFRLVLHYWIDDAGVERAVNAFADVLGAQ